MHIFFPHILTSLKSECVINWWPLTMVTGGIFSSLEAHITKVLQILHSILDLIKQKPHLKSRLLSAAPSWCRTRSPTLLLSGTRVYWDGDEEPMEARRSWLRLVGHLSVTWFCLDLLLSSSGWHTPPPTLAPTKDAHTVLNLHRGLLWLHLQGSSPGFRYSLRTRAVSQLPFNLLSLVQCLNATGAQYIKKKKLNTPPPPQLLGCENLWPTVSEEMSDWLPPQLWWLKVTLWLCSQEALSECWGPDPGVVSTETERGALRSLHRNNKCIL